MTIAKTAHNHFLS